MQIRILSIRQPWAWLIVNGYKPIENRTWPSNYTGDLYIHAAKKYDVFINPQAIKKQIGDVDKYEKYLNAKLLFGGLVGKVRMVDCVDCHKSVWFYGDWSFVFEDPETIPFHPMRGQLGIFRHNI